MLTGSSLKVVQNHGPQFVKTLKVKEKLRKKNEKLVEEKVLM